MAQLIQKVLKDQMWRGQPIFVVGGGPSLKGFDWSKLRGHRVIAVNKAFQKVPKADIHLTMDGRFLQLFWGDLKKLDGFKVMVDGAPMEYPKDNSLLLVRCMGERIISERLRWGLGTGANSGYCAMNLALLLGGSPVILLGFDLHPTRDGKGQWFHKGYEWDTAKGVYDQYLRNFEWAAAQKYTFNKVRNASLTSAIRGFPFISDLEDIKSPRRPLKVNGTVVVGYYTNDFYRIEGARMVASSAMFDLPLRFESWDDHGSWVSNTQQKANFLRWIIDRVQGRDILYVDADAVFRKNPLPFLNRLPDTVNIAAHYMKPGELLSGTIFLRNCNRTKHLLDDWIRLNKEDPGAWDQGTLNAVVKTMDDNEFFALPPAYTFIFDTMRRMYPHIEPVIEHYQASRTLKRLKKRG